MQGRCQIQTYSGNEGLPQRSISWDGRRLTAVAAHKMWRNNPRRPKPLPGACGSSTCVCQVPLFWLWNSAVFHEAMTRHARQDTNNAPKPCMRVVGADQGCTPPRPPPSHSVAVCRKTHRERELHDQSLVLRYCAVLYCRGTIYRSDDYTLRGMTCRVLTGHRGVNPRMSPSGMVLFL